MKLHTTSFGLPAPGKTESEDAFAVCPDLDGGLLCVLSDGVSAARDPRRCAERVVRLVSESFAARPANWPARQTLDRLVDQANASLAREGTYMDGVPSMQATLAAVHFSENHLSGLNVGDSPVYLVREGSIERLSRSHSMRNGDGHEMLTCAIGMDEAVSPHHFERELRAGDLVMIASDGLTHLLSDTELGALASRFGSARLIIQEAQRNAPEATDLDDLSAIVVEVRETDTASPRPDERKAYAFPHPARGQVFEGYNLLRPMAGNDRVWLAEREGQRFVLKFSPADAASDEQLHARFVREAWNASRFQNEFFVRSALPESGSPHYYIMDYVEAPSLRFMLKSRRLAAEEAVELCLFLTRACQWLLGRELIHGDIKPDNILIYRTGDGLGYKLLDLGLASPVFTDSGIAGTPTYLAPERFAGAVVTERTEIYAIGATLYEMLTGRPPFGEIERFQKPAFYHPPRLASYWNPNVPPWLDAVLLKCLSIRQMDRFQHFSELLYALEHPQEAPPLPERFEGLLIRNPLLFYKIGFWLLLAVTIALLIRILTIS